MFQGVLKQDFGHPLKESHLPSTLIFAYYFQPGIRYCIPARKEQMGGLNKGL